MTLAVDSAGGTSQVSAVLQQQGSLTVIQHREIAQTIRYTTTDCYLLKLCPPVVCQSVCDAGRDGDHACIGCLPETPSKGRRM